MKKLYMLWILLIGLFSTGYAANEILIGGEAYHIDTLGFKKIGPDAWYTHVKFTQNSGSIRLMAYFLDINARNPYTEIRAVKAQDKNVATERPSSMATRKSQEGAVYFAGTNADFFSTKGDVGMPVGGCIVGGQVTRIPNDHPAFGMDNGTSLPYIGNMTFSGQVTAGENHYNIATVNAARGENQLVLYNSFFGTSTQTNGYGTEVQIVLEPGYDWEINTDIKARVTEMTTGTGNMNIGAGQAVLSGHGEGQVFLNKLQVGDVIDLCLNVSGTNITGAPRISDLVSGDRIILANGEVLNNDWAERHPRTAIGMSKDSARIYFCVVDGRSASSSGCTTKHLAAIIASAGAWTAVNLDGGGSSAMYIKELGVMNETSDGPERAVSNGIFAVCTAPTDEEIAEIRCEPYKIRLPRYGVIKPRFLGYNQYGVLLNSDMQGVEISCEPSLGYITEDGRLVVTHAEGGVLHAVYNQATADIPVEVVAGVEIEFRLDSVLIDNRIEYPIEVIGQVGLNTMEIMPSSLTWQVEDPSVCEVNEGILTGLSNGVTSVTGKLGDFTSSLKVKVEIPEAPVMIQDDFSDPDSWTVKLTSELKDVAVGTTGYPAGWNHGLNIQYTYTSGRAPMAKLTKPMYLYGLPDTIKFTYNAGDIPLKQLIIGLRPNNASSSVATTFKDALPLNQDVTLSIATSDLVTDATDIAVYPIAFDYVAFYLDPVASEKNKRYALNVKELSLCYQGVETGLVDPTVFSGLHVYPNPVTNGMIYVELQQHEVASVGVEIVSPAGILLQQIQATASDGKVAIPVNRLSSGIYFLKINQGDRTDVVKMLIQ